MPTPGDFSATALQDITLKAEEMWTDSKLLQQVKAETVTATAVKARAGARWKQDEEKDNVVKVTWIDPCDAPVKDCESNCDISGAELSTDSKTYTPGLCKMSDFSVNAEVQRTNMYTLEEMAALGLAKAIKGLDEWWNLQAVTKLKAFSGINVSPEPYTYASGTTTVPAASWNLDLIPELMLDLKLNRMGAAYLLNNGNLWTEYWKAEANAKNMDGAGAQYRAMAAPMLFDFYGFSAAGVTEDIFAVNPAALAFITTNRHKDVPQVLGGTIGQTRYTVNSSIPGIKYDVFYTMKCITNSTTGKANIVHSWRLETNGDIFLNPAGCEVTVGGQAYNPTGIISYSKGS